MRGWSGEPGVEEDCDRFDEDNSEVGLRRIGRRWWLTESRERGFEESNVRICRGMRSNNMDATRG